MKGSKIGPYKSALSQNNDKKIFFSSMEFIEFEGKHQFKPIDGKLLPEIWGYLNEMHSDDIYPQSWKDPLAKTTPPIMSTHDLAREGCAQW